MENTFSRRITNGPRVYIAGDGLPAPYRFPICNQLVVEGRGSIGLQELRRATRLASEANPSTRLIYKGWGKASRLVDSGVTPPVTELDGAGWSGYDFNGIPFYERLLPIRTGPVSEVLFFRGDPARLVFRTHHGVTDGQGTAMWIEDVFRALGGEAPVGSGWTESIDQYRNIVNLPEPKWNGENCLAPTGRPEQIPPGLAFSRIDINGPVSRLLPRLALLTAEAAWQNNGPGQVIFGIPLSLRPRRPEARSSSNLSRALYMEVNRETTVDDIQTRVRTYLEKDGPSAVAERVIPYLPLWVLRRYLEKGVRKGLQTGRYWVSGFLSNVGRFRSDQVSGGGFTARRVFAIPPCGLLTPFFLTVMSLDDTITICVSLPAHLATHNRDRDFMAYLEKQLS